MRDQDITLTDCKESLRKSYEAKSKDIGWRLWLLSQSGAVEPQCLGGSQAICSG